MILKAFVLPHPPIVLPEIGGGEERKIAITSTAMDKAGSEILELAPDVIILTSPHAPLYSDGFYIAGGDRASGSLSQFRAPEICQDLELDRELSKSIHAFASSERLPSALIEPNAGLDHGVMIPLYFVLRYYSKFKLVHIGLSMLSAEDHYRLGICIRKAVEELGRRAVFIASGDCSHVLKHDGPYGYRKEGPLFDEKLMDILSRAAFGELLRIPEKLSDRAAECGLRSFQIMAGALDGSSVKPGELSYEGTFGVGYGVQSFSIEGEDSRRHFLENAPPDDKALGEAYLSLALESIRRYLEKGETITLPKGLPQKLYGKSAGCFVTLHRNGALRGCIGTMQGYKSCLGEEIISNAVSAANRDPRFPPLSAPELEGLSISVDILGEMEKIDSTEELDPERYGVYVTKGFRSGVLLPRLEGVDSIERQLEIALSKAGIMPNEKYTLSRFEVKRYE